VLAGSGKFGVETIDEPTVAASSRARRAHRCDV